MVIYNVCYSVIDSEDLNKAVVRGDMNMESVVGISSLNDLRVFKNSVRAAVRRDNPQHVDKFVLFESITRVSY